MNSVQNIEGSQIQAFTKAALDLGLDAQLLIEVEQRLALELERLGQNSRLRGLLAQQQQDQLHWNNSLRVAFWSLVLAHEAVWVSDLWKTALVQAAFLRDIAHEVGDDHPGKAVAMLDALGFDNEPVKQIIWQHHERMDGQGYPSHIQGRWIYPPARIAFMADALANGVDLNQSSALYDPELLKRWQTMVHGP